MNNANHQCSNSISSRKILGIDPGIGIVGFGLVTVYPDGALYAGERGVLTTSKDKSDSQRLQEIYQDMTQLLDDLRPDVVSVEQLFFFRNAKTMVPVSQARGVILLTLENQALPVFEYTPMQVKQALTGYGKAAKQEVQEMITCLLNLDEIPRPDDVADALAMAVCHYHHHERFQAAKALSATS